MTPALHILAAEEFDLSKVIIGGVFFLIWVVSQAVAVIAKKTEEQKRKRMEEMERMPQAPPGIPRLPPARQPAPPRKPASSGRRVIPPMRLPTPKQQNRSKTPPALPRAPKPTPPFAASAPIAAAPSAPHPIAPPKRQTSANAPAIRTWLNPATLRQQFILTELLQPPLALRDPDSRRIM